MPTATAKPAQKANVTEKIIRTEVRDPVEVSVEAPRVPVEPREDFWKYIHSLTDEDWKTHHVTLYRYPLGQPKPDKLGRYVKTYKHGCPLLSEEQIFEEFGGSQYTALLKGPRNGQPWTLIANHSWEMDGPTKNPWQTSSAAVAGAPVNSDLTSTLQVVLQHLKAAERSANPAGDPALKESISLIQQLTAAMPKPEGVKELVAGLASLKALTGESGGGGLRETLSLLKELGILGEAREKRSLAAEIKEILEISSLVNGGGGDAPRAGRVDWPTALVQNLPGILEKVTPIADKFADAARSNARVAELRAGGRPVPPSSPATRPLPAASVTPAPTAAATVPAAESPAPRVVQAPETEPTTEAAPSPFRAPNLEWVKGRAVQMFLEGKSGDVIAEFLDNLDAQLGAFLASMDEPAFRAFVEGDPILKQIASAPRYPGFVADFVDYFSEDEADNVPESTIPK
jgi:hypothetical protein